MLIQRSQCASGSSPPWLKLEFSIPPPQTSPPWVLKIWVPPPHRGFFLVGADRNFQVTYMVMSDWRVIFRWNYQLSLSNKPSYLEKLVFNMELYRKAYFQGLTAHSPSWVLQWIWIPHPEFFPLLPLETFSSPSWAKLSQKIFPTLILGGGGTHYGPLVESGSLVLGKLGKLIS